MIASRCPAKRPRPRAEIGCTSVRQDRADWHVNDKDAPHRGSSVTKHVFLKAVVHLIQRGVYGCTAICGPPYLGGCGGRHSVLYCLSTAGFFPSAAALAVSWEPSNGPGGIKWGAHRLLGTSLLVAT